MERFARLAALLFATSTAAVPAPKSEPSLFPGMSDMQWGSIKQVTHWNPDGTYQSPGWGDGTWEVQGEKADGFITILFLEGSRWYAICVDANGIGKGCMVWWDDAGFTRYGWNVDVKLIMRKADK